MCDDNDDNNRQTTAYVKQTLTGLLKNLPAPTVMGQENPDLGKKMYPPKNLTPTVPPCGGVSNKFVVPKIFAPNLFKMVNPFL